VAEFVAEHYGDEAVDYLAEPLLSGIYGGSPRTLSVASVLPKFVELETRYGSLTKGVLAERKAAAGQGGNHLPLFRSLRGGLGQLVDALSRALAEKARVIHARAETVERRRDGFGIRIDGAWMETDRLVLACEAHNAAALIEGVDPRLAELLGAVTYGSSMTVALGFEKSAFPRALNGFGFLVPKRERRRLVACTWVGTKFAHRVPEGLVLLRCFLGGVEDAGILNESDDQVIAAVLDELRNIVGLAQAHLFSRIFRWPRSMAQYEVGHQQRLAEIEERRGTIPGLHLAGNAYLGIGLPDCIRAAMRAAEQIAISEREPVR
jgi:oxygen-dependent protoporphyrinogen oxidase